MKRFLTTALVAATFLPVWLAPLTPTFLADNSGGTETTHIAAMGGI